MTQGHRSRKKRIVRRAVMVIAGVILALSLYLSSYCGVFWLFGKQAVNEEEFASLRATVFWPINVYGLSDWPGGRSIRVTAYWCMFRSSGTEFAWDEVDSHLDVNE